MEDTVRQTVKSKRDTMVERVKGRHPDKDFADEEALFAQINDDYDGYDKELSGYRQREKTFSDMFTADPRSAAFLTNWRKGGDPVVELVRQFGTDIKDALDDPERQEAIAAANKEFIKRVSREKGLEEEYAKNLEQSLKDIEAYQHAHGMSDGQVDALMESVMTIVKDGVMGRFSPATLEMVQKAVSHDADVDMAGAEGEIRGRNAKIEERLRSEGRGDGTARLGGNSGEAARPRRRMSIFDMAREAR